MPTEKEMARQKAQWEKLPYSEKKKLIKKWDVMIEKEYRTHDFEALRQRLFKKLEEVGYLKKQNQVPVGDRRGFGFSGLFFRGQ